MMTPRSLLLTVFFLPLLAFGQSFGPDKIAEVVAKGSEGTHVFLEGAVEEIDTVLHLIKLKDGSGSMVVDASEKAIGQFTKDDRLSVTGKVMMHESGTRVKASSVRKIRYVKDPARCCMPD